MTLRLTPRTLEAAYDYLRTTPPFDRWKLPPGGDVKFVITRSKSDAGWHKIDNGRDVIAASCGCIGRTESLLELMAHEMVHMRQRAIGTDSGVRHNRNFYTLARRICRIHGFDPKLF